MLQVEGSSPFMALANAERGEVVVTTKDNKTYTLKLGMNVAVAYQKKTKKKIGDVMTDCSGLDFETIRTLAWLLLQKYHADEFKTEEQAGEFMDDAGGVGRFLEIITEIMEVDKPKKGTGTGNPPDDQASGTGESSTSTPG